MLPLLITYTIFALKITYTRLALIDMEISHEEFNVIIREKQKYEGMKENVTNASEKQGNIRWYSLN